MPIVAPASGTDGAFTNVTSAAGVAQITSPVIPNPIVASIPATSGTWNSGVIVGDGFRYLTVAVTMSQAGSLVITEYLDLASTIARPALSTPIVAATPLIVDIADLKPFVGFSIQINNTGASPGAVTSFAVLMSAG